MALFTKQDFTPPLFSRRWFAVKFRPNVLLYSRENIILILESGLLFREDSIDVEQESPAPEEMWKYAGGGKNGWMTSGERVASAVGVAVAVLLFPPRSFTRSSLLNLSVYASVPVICRYAHRSRCRGSLGALLSVMREYLALARRTAACLKEIHWLHKTIIPHITEEFQNNYEALERMYRLLKNSSNKDIDTKKLGTAFNDNWIYSEIHTGVAKSCLELKLALNKSNSLDVFLDSCAMNKQEIDLEVLNRDLDDIIDGLTKCLKTVQSSQLRLKKIQNKNVENVQYEDKEVMVENVDILKIEDRVPESKDEVFYFVRTDDDDSSIQPADDLTTAPGKKEKDANKIVLSELKRKLGKREDVMRERERQALAKTMPELKDIPEFPRQINLDEFIERKGYIKKLKLKLPKKKVLHNQTKKSRTKNKRYKLKLSKYTNEADISDVLYEANAKLNVKSKLLSISFLKDYYITKWCKLTKKDYSDSSGLSEGLSDPEPSTTNKKTQDFANEIRFSKKDLELTPSSSESDFENYKKNRQKALLNDVRRHRAVRKKNHPNHRPVRTTDNVDESLKPMEYSFGTGLAMASVLQVNKSVPKYIADEEIFIGDGEVSTDSGNDEDA
ncbi:hypothetical protein B5X24_HaOG209920 [Helicoverpa armigera]|uniref:Uncharacterized protein n=1 Tax=Helicoverpa armigera TaxID=29058 RepID=A0A2W1BEC0_HELAM|nr:hypothetical protein B5X24_HaOG209920 [Helicoverpa armigera]